MRLIVSNSHSALARHSRRMWFSSATLVCESSPVGSSLPGAKLAAFISPPKGLTGVPIFSFPVFLCGQPLLVPEAFRAPFVCTGVLGLDEDNVDLPVFKLPALLVGAIGYEEEDLEDRDECQVQ